LKKVSKILVLIGVILTIVLATIILNASSTYNDIYGNNDTFDTATFYNIDNYNHVITAEIIGDYKDVDYFKFYCNGYSTSGNGVTSGNDVEVRLSPPNSLLDYELELYDSSGNKIAQSYKGPGETESISMTLSHGYYYAKIYGYDQDNSSSNYGFVIRNEDAFEPNNTAAENTFVSSYYYNVWATIGCINDVDYYNLSYYDLVPRQVITLVPPSGYDYDLVVTDETGNIIGQSYNGGSTTESITVTTKPNEIYHIKVYGYDGDWSKDKYKLYTRNVQ